MLRSVDSTPDTHHVRHLDHRANRLDPDDNFCGLTQYTDTPSVYAPTYFSPSLRPQHDGSFSPRDRLNDPNMSSLDLDDDPRFSLAVSHSGSTGNDDDDSHSFEDNDDAGERQTDEADTRLSYLGPKMRFHSRAPWEMEGDIPEEEEDLVEHPKHHGFPFSFGGGSRGNNSTGSSSPRPSFGRPSGDSSRSHLMPKRSFDTINSQMSSKGALYALAQESLSSTSLARPNPPPQKDSLFGKLSSLGRARGNSSPSSPVLLPTRPRANSKVPSIHHNPLDSVSQVDYDPFAANQSHYPMVHSSRPQSPVMDDAIHPYANPDALPDRNSTYSTALQPSHHPIRNDSSITVTQKFDPNSSTASRNSVTSSIAASKNRVSSIHGREISSPVAIQGTSLPPEMSGFDGQAGGASHLPGWKEKFVPPAFNLISLEEARALRAKPQPPPPADDATPMQSVADLVSPSTSTHASTEVSVSTIYQDPSPNSYNRGRTISTGTKAKHAFQSMVGMTDSRRDSEPSITPTQPAPVSQLPTKPLKHKKSGFMRLFNGSKDKEPDEPPPPIPSTSNASDVASLNVKRVVSRVPVPPYSQPPSGQVSPQDAGFSALSTQLSISPTKRGPPTLSIDTVSSNSQSRNMQDQQRYQQRTTSSLYAPKPWAGGEQPPASAPPDMAGFPALKLRPVSSLFSSGFEHIVPELATSSDFDTPTSFSPNGPLSPITPGKTDRFSKSDSAARPSTTSSQLASSQRRVSELEDQVRALKLELEVLRLRQSDRVGPYCNSCGRGHTSPGARNGSMSSNSTSSSSSSGSGGTGYTSVLNRPRAKTSTASRFVNALA